MIHQSAPAVILVRPTGFGYDPVTAESNGFQRLVADADLRHHAGAEFDALLDALRHCGIRATVLDPADPAAPNGVFPNNWFSTHPDGTIVLYPMCAATRRSERDPALRSALEREGFHVQQVLDLSSWEQRGLFLEGTGSVVIDRLHHRAYACISPRTSEPALNAWCEYVDLVPVAFNATMDGTLTGAPVYHTNVVMSIGEGFAVVCLEALPYPAERQEVEEELHAAGKEVIPISLDQMHRYVGNLLQLRGTPLAGSPERLFILLSETAFLALHPEQRLALQRHGQLVPVPVPTIEAVGGGSVRCMLAENFLGRA
jgi:hypothetical protein